MQVGTIKMQSHVAQSPASTMTLTPSSDDVNLDAIKVHLTQLLHRPSTTPNDAGCQQYLKRILKNLGFSVEDFEVEGVSNLIAKIGTGSTRIAFSGHTDVVSALNLDLWKTEPFSLSMQDDKLIGCGIADMKGAIASMLMALEHVLPELDLEKFTLYFLITSDEVGDAEYGTKEIVSRLAQTQELPHYCIVGEPTSIEQSGDVLKIGRRGSISAEITIIGQHAHVAYPQNAKNASHTAVVMGKWLTQQSWDQGSDDFPGSHLEITGIHTDNSGDNIIPGECRLNFNVRYSHKETEANIKQRIVNGLVQLKQLTNDISIRWYRSCEPYYTSGETANSMNDTELTNQSSNTNVELSTNDSSDAASKTAALPIEIDLVAQVEQAIFDVTKRFPRLSTAGGTSGGRFIAKSGCQVIELGLPSHTIHQVNEFVTEKDILDLTNQYLQILQRMAGK
jgi:succinyl-diaminopimelate desuccinylase